MAEDTVKGISTVESGLSSALAATTPDPLVSKEATEYKLYKRRWIVLALFVLYSASNAMQWIQYSIIADVIHKYYSVSYLAIDWTSMIFMITYIPLIFPASWILTKKVSRTNKKIIFLLKSFVNKSDFCIFSKEEFLGCSQ